jgi:outer membrane protein assembly factor BamE (lipoprotein component of BamABCDE complex)
MNKLSVLILGLIVLGGCVDSGNPTVRDPRVISSIQKGYTTKAQLKTMLGEPQKVTTDSNGTEIWRYSYNETEIDGETFIPIYGLFAGGASSNVTDLDVYFDTNGIVTEYMSSQGNYRYDSFGQRQHTPAPVTQR